MKLRTILLSAFLGMAAITLAIGLTAFLMSSVTLKAKGEVIALGDVEADLLNAVSAHHKWKGDLEGAFIENTENIAVQFDGHACGFGTWFYEGGLDELRALSPDAADMISRLESDHLSLHTTAQRMDESWSMIHPGLGEELFRRLSDHNSWATTLMEDILQGQSSDVETDHTRCGFGEFLSSDWNRELEESWPEYRSLMTPIREHHENLHKAVIEINAVEDPGEKYRIFNLTVAPELEYIGESFHEIISLEEKLVQGQAVAKSIFNTETVQYLHNVESGINGTIGLLGEEKTALEARSDELNTIQNFVIWIGIVVGVLIGILIAILITRSISRKLGGEPAEISVIAENIAKGNLDLEFDEREALGVFESMKEMTNSLTEIVSSVLSGSEQIATASEQIASGNQDLSNRTEQQASALEETSAAIEEMNASIKSNADNTQTADQLSREAVNKTEEGSDTIREMVTSMDEINISSNRISDIIEVITNIAFQTNLLALNASIEAARAGEQGKGFAVVAVEVRKLAKRSDKAANEITEIIKNSSQKVTEGVDIANKAGVVLNEINDAVRKVTALVGEISAASQEQLSSASEIDKTLASLDENTQKNAALVEEAASSTEELSAQAQELNSSMRFFKIKSSSAGFKNQEVKLPSEKHPPIQKMIETPAKKEGRYESFSDLVDEGEFDEF